ncbi:MAG: hypothetical protein ABJA70_06445 [Chryseolinea sp.]
MTLNPILPLWLIVSLLVAMTIAFVWMEYGRPLKYKYLRLIAICIMMLSVAGLCLRPEYQSTMESNTVLLTEQYSKKIVDSLLKKNPALDLIRSNEAAEFKNSKVLVSYQQLFDPTVKIKAVVGNGIPEYAMASVGAKFE